MANDGIILARPDREPRPTGYDYTPIDATTREGAATYARRQRAAAARQWLADNAAAHRLRCERRRGR